MAERLIVVGGDAGGMAAATEARRRRPDMEIIALEKGRWTSYSACGIPYLVGGEVGELDDLVVRTPQQFRDKHLIDVRTRHEVTGIDVAKRTVEVRDHEHGRTYTTGFDTLHLGLGAVPLRPDLPGVELPHIHGVQTLEDADHLLADAQEKDCRDIVVVGGGYIGLEMAEAFVRRGLNVTIVERDSEVMSTLDPDMGGIVSEAMRSEGITVRCGEAVVAFEEKAVVTENGPVHADLVVLGLGVVPNSGLAADAGVATGVKGAVRVDPRQRTSVDGVWAAGDCAESFHLVSRRPVHIPLGTHANKQARVAGVNIGGGYATFPGVVGTAATKLCGTEIARTGLTEREATAAGLGYVVARITSTTRAGYLAKSGRIVVKMLAEKRSGRLLGAQLIGTEGAAKRVDIVATALTAGMTVEQMTALDLSYAPPFSPVWDPVLVAARKAAELVSGGA
ncbi:MAG: FAD-dependent oxidoreductase [Actinobacteria bacterium]|nr:FAD-dependent oxidoreductase [Actinomycetota bacterium]